MSTPPLGAPKERKPIDIDALPWYQSPWLWGTVIGIATVTLLRPCTQYIPEPLSPLGPTPSWLSEAAPTQSLVTIATLWEPDCAPCDRTVAGLAEVSRRSSWLETPYEFRVVVLSGTDTRPLRPTFAYEPGWSVVEVERPEGWDRGVFSAHIPSEAEASSKWTNFIHEGWVWILGNDGRIRGPLRAQNADGESEVFHRAQRVIHALSEGHELPR